MKDIILYNYHIEIKDIKEYKDYSVFQMEENIFYFTKLKRSEKEFKELLEVMEEVIKKNNPIFRFVPNVAHSYITMVEQVPYVLVLAKDIYKEYDIFEIIKYQALFSLNTNKSSLYRNEWGILWGEKVDYLEYQVHERGKEFPIILSCFSYYVGLAENAICYVKYIEKNIQPKNIKIVLSHRRVNYPNYRLNFDNPLNFIFDIEVRDIASYIKSMFFKEPDEAMIDLKTYIKICQPDLYSLSMLYARLLYPSYYFDLHEKIMEHEIEEECLLKIIDNIQEYEKFLNETWHLFRQYVPIEPIPWLIEKKLQ